jgi:hypothetical protein
MWQTFNFLRGVFMPDAGLVCSGENIRLSALRKAETPGSMLVRALAAKALATEGGA